MIHAQEEKCLLMTPVAIVAGATVTHTFDTLGYDYATFDVILDSQAATSSICTTLKLGEGSVSNSSSATDITAFVGGGAGGFTIPTTISDSTGTIVRFNVDLKARDRHLLLTASPQDTNQIIGAVCHLSRGDEMPNTTTEAGVIVLQNG